MLDVVGEFFPTIFRATVAYSSALVLPDNVFLTFFIVSSTAASANFAADLAESSTADLLSSKLFTAASLTFSVVPCSPVHPSPPTLKHIISVIEVLLCLLRIWRGEMGRGLPEKERLQFKDPTVVAFDRKKKNDELRLKTASSSSSSTTVVVAQDNPSQALLKFKTSIANADPALANWGSSPNPCSENRANWAGILCFNGYVWGLQLENMNLKGQIDVNALTPLRYLRTLSFMNNSFEGVMPDWKKLGALKSLYLSNNHFSGEVPDDAFKGMTSLKKIYMANNRFAGPIPTSLESPKLIELRLENNHFTGTIPSISSEHLKILNVSNNQLEGPIPTPLLDMDPTSFSGNKGLCGPKPPLQSCEPHMEPSLLSPLNGSKSPESSPSPARIAIIVLSSLIGLFLLVLLFLVYRRSRKSSQTPQLRRELMPPASAFTPSASKKSNISNAAAVATHTTGGNSGKKGGEQQQQQGGAGKLSFVRDDQQKFELQDLMRASAEVLGSGNFGASYKAVLVDGEALVVKRFKQMNNVAKEDFHEHMRRLGRLKNSNLLPLVAYLYRKEEKLLVFDYVNNGSLSAHLHGKHSSRLSWARRLKIIKGVVKGLNYLHTELPALTIPHGHLKSSNVLIDDEFNPQLMDYTLAPVVNPNQVHEILVAYKSPDYAKTGRVCKKTDVWCLGILILETLTGKFVAKYISQGSGQYSGELTGWVNAIVGESSAQVCDKEMEVSDEGRIQMERLLQIGIACCQEDLDKRLDLEEALKQIQEVQES
ncbi:leucine-rich repeat protein kinase family protein [Striga asiatica]|uniref:Leucine-rich repeat protein kinase family protein n=1 Tax=Striga asiatica TaxID=4170 RepID=A0A5A7QI69_STRAF|nr:leucine-rich repeat protein kinase family protein [Striga asiatica]